MLFICISLDVRLVLDFAQFISLLWVTACCQFVVLHIRFVSVFQVAVHAYQRQIVLGKFVSVCVYLVKRSEMM